jgi:hypothetical protein
MRFAGLIAGAAVAATFVAGAVDASAQTRRAPSTTALAISEAPASQSGARRGLQWNENGRWGLNLNLQQPVGREADWSDVQAGAYYRINPSLRVGAAAVLAEPERDPARAAETDRRGQPRVRLETIFRF